jgi:peptidoglycan hydrolase CwlO-like protein
VGKLSTLLELNDKFEEGNVESLVNLEEHLDTLYFINDNMELIQDLADTVPELQNIKEVIDDLPDQINTMIDEVQGLVDTARQESADFEQNITDATEYWENINDNLLPQLKTITGVFSSVEVWDLTTTTPVASGTYLEVPPYNYEWASLIVTINGLHSNKFTKVAPIDSFTVFSKYIVINENLPTNTLVEGIVFTSPNNTLTPATIIHDSTLTGDGTGDNPLGIDSSVLSDISSNNKSFTSLQARVVTLEGDNSTNKASITSLFSKDSNLEGRISTLETRSTGIVSDVTANKNNISLLQTSVNGHTSSINLINSNIGVMNSTITNNSTKIANLETRVTNNTSAITSLTTKANTAESDINALEVRVTTGEAQSKDNNTAIATLQTGFTSLSAIVDALPTVSEIPGIVESTSTERFYVSDATVTSTATSGTLNLTLTSNKGNTSTVNRSVPLASVSSSGLMSVALYNQIVDMQTSINTLVNGVTVVIDNSVSDTATAGELDTAWANGTANPKIEGSVIEKWSSSLRWVWRGTQWYGPYSFNTISIANNTQTGLVKGTEDITTNSGGIAVSADGSMYTIGYASLASLVSTYQSKIDTLNNSLLAAQADITALANRVNALESVDIIFNGRITANETKINSNSTNITSLSNRLDLNDASTSSLNTRMGTAEGILVTHGSLIDNIQSILGTSGSDLSEVFTRLTDAETIIIEHTSDITTINTELDGIDTNLTTLNTSVGTNTTNISSLTSRITTNEEDILDLGVELGNHNYRVWITSIQITLPYTANTPIEVPSYKVGVQALNLYINGVRTDQFIEVDTTHVALTTGITGTDTVQLLIDCYKN